MMRPGQNQKRRNNNGRPNQHGGGQHGGGGGQHGGQNQNRRFQHSGNRTYDSNGPDVKVRGTAAQVYEKYQALARDAHASGDNVMAENYLQHAEHYYRLMNVGQAEDGQQNRAPRRDFAADFSETGEGEAAADQRRPAPEPAAESEGFTPPAFMQSPQPAQPAVDPNGPQPDVAPQGYNGGNGNNGNGRFANRGRDRFPRRFRQEDGQPDQAAQPVFQPEAQPEPGPQPMPQPDPVLAAPAAETALRRPGRPRLSRAPAQTEALALELAPAAPAPATALGDAEPVKRRPGRPRRVKTEAESVGE